MNTSSATLQADLAYQKVILGSVSRTFALTIPLLPEALEKVVGNAYLLCRIVDTIEDAPDLSPPTKQALSQLFLDSVMGKITAEEFIRPCLAALNTHSNPSELDLIEHTPAVLRILHACSPKDQEAVNQCVSIMSLGMSRFHTKQSTEGLSDLAEFEEYCYVVAGVVGELLTNLFGNHSSHFAQCMRSHESLSVGFGQALQMTNILKDSSEDRARGVSWKPSKMSQIDLLNIAYRKLMEACNYILIIPKEEVGIRRFCFLAFGLAALTLNTIAQKASAKKISEPKLTRKVVWGVYGFTKLAAHSNLLVKLFFYLSSQDLRKLAKSSYKTPS
ncbi:squalene/phytoene synthase family protein [Polynucleobacter paneuropaeus]|nr:squalene/phytoene synthase family protein [Polynucleobacter paneuropaeus]QWD05933.1 squalene/phytoene synthase family protein [Polynucleobacter paneuropaeus]QWD21763.1 squalene/phytoene synthase family protein [Polynucleobacter paneuropaeus]